MSSRETPSPSMLEAMREIGEIAVTRAADGLSTLLQKKVEISVSHATVVPLKALFGLFSGMDSSVSIVQLRSYGEGFKGAMFLLLQYSQSYRLAQLATGGTVAADFLNDEFYRSSLQEIGNIMCGCYLNEWAAATDRQIMHKAPELTTAVLSTVMDSVLEDMGEVCDDAMLLETVFTLGGDQCEGMLLFITTGSVLDDLGRDWPLNGTKKERGL
jgi:chemotaxis protein CheC